MIQFGKNLEALRLHKDKKQKDVAKEVGITASSYNNYERGVSFPNIMGLIELAKYFDVSETDLLHSRHILDKIGTFKKWVATEVSLDSAHELPSLQEVLKSKEETIASLKELVETQKTIIQSYKKRFGK